MVAVAENRSVARGGEKRLGRRGRVVVLLPRGKICRRGPCRTGPGRRAEGRQATARHALFLPRWQTTHAGREAGDPLQSSSRRNNEIPRCGVRGTRDFK